jgi:predicted phosphodiesterase
MEAVAVLSDIHGVLPALDAVLAEPAVLAADRIVLTGDIAAGPQPGEVLDRLIGLGDRVTWVRGNADRELIELARGEVDDVGDPIAHWAARQLGPDHLDRLASLPLSALLDVGGFGPVLFCHATPRDDAEVVVVDSRLERWAEVLAGLPDEVMTVVCGHTHMPFARLANRRQVVNPGSVACPTGGPGRTGRCCPTAPSSSGGRPTTCPPPAPRSAPSRPTRTSPSGPTTSCPPGPATPTRSRSWPPATAGYRPRSPLFTS